jgi:hypothetical protein
MADPVTIPLSLYQKEIIKLADAAVAYATKERDSFIRGVVSASFEGNFANVKIEGDSLVVEPVG